MFKFTTAILRNSKNNLGLFSTTRLNFSASPTSVELKNSQIDRDSEKSDLKFKNVSKGNNIVAAAFASLSLESNKSSNGDIKTPFTDSRIEKAETVNDLLQISDGNGISRRHALKVVSILADWSSKGKIQLTDFESDPRFIKLCKVLTKGTYYSKTSRISPIARNEDLSTIMNVTADDEAAKLVASITLPQMVKVMQTLALKKRRSTMLLRSLAFNVTRSNEKLDLKQSADLLYSMCVLNFPDENLLEKIGTDITTALDDRLKKSAVVGSIVTSLGLLRYKDSVGVLDALCNWMLKNHEICRPQDIFALFLTLAVLNFEPTSADKLYETLIPQVSQTDADKPNVWLDLVWSLVLLNKATNSHVSSVLSDKFYSEIESGNSFSKSVHLKLLNVQAAANVLLPSYEGDKIGASSAILKTMPTRTKEKDEMVASVLDSLKNLMQSETYIKSNVNTGMGFFIDAECVFDKKSNPVDVEKHKSSPDHIKVAIMIQDYNDMCRGRVEPTGVNVLATRLLEAKGYKILHIPFNEYKPKDKVVQRVQYIETKLKSLLR